VCGEHGEECSDDELDAITGGGNGYGLEPEPDLDSEDKPLEDMKPGDIITFTEGGSTYNYMLGLMDNGGLGFWDLDSHAYIPYALAVNMVDSASAWTTFKKVDPKTLNSYEVMNSSSTPFALPEYAVDWTGGMDDNPAYVEIRTEVDWENVLSQFLWAVLGPSLVTSFWGNAKPTVTPLSQAGYYPLTNYVAALAYFANDGAAIVRYPVIHP
jgi:hypothetical protein